jgi:hypothetical protein
VRRLELPGEDAVGKQFTAVFVVNLVAGGWKALKNSSGNIRMWGFCRGLNRQNPLASGSFSHGGKRKRKRTNLKVGHYKRDF